MLLGGGFRLRYALVIEGVGLVDEGVEAVDEGGGRGRWLHHALGEGVGGHLVVFLVHAEADLLGALYGVVGLCVGALLGQGCVLLVLLLQRGHYLGEGERRQRLGHAVLVEVYQQALDGGRLLQVARRAAPM